MSHSQKSESIEVCALLALSGGLMDSYSYLARGHVFANAQTGNILLLGVNLAHAQFLAAAQYAIPIMAFALGIALSELIKMHYRGPFHWRQLALALEIVLLAIASLQSFDHNLIANSLTSLACGLQVQAFRKLHGHSIATTMCIGNLRSGTEAWIKYFFEGEKNKKRHYLHQALASHGTIVVFVLGAVIGSFALGFFSNLTLLTSCVLLGVALLIMLKEPKESGLAEHKK